MTFKRLQVQQESLNRKLTLVVGYENNDNYGTISKTQCDNKRSLP